MTALFQQLPSVDKFLKTPEGEMLLTEFGHSAVVRELRQLLSEGREFIKQHQNLPHFFCRSPKYITLFTTSLGSTKSCTN